MDLRFFLDQPFWLLMALVLAYSVYRAIRYCGMRGGMLGAVIRRTTGAVAAGGVRGLSHQLKVYELDSTQPDRQVGLELLSTGPMHYEVQAVALSADAARELARLLRAAVRAAP